MFLLRYTVQVHAYQLARAVAGATTAGVLTLGCGGTPAQPSAVPVRAQTSSIRPRELSCPASFEAYSSDGNPVTVPFGKPLALDSGEEVVEAQCRPQPGDRFPVGSTTVTCTLEDRGTEISTCTFSVTVRFRRLVHTRFLAYGDSITEGYIPPVTVQTPADSLQLDWDILRLSPGLPTSYPYQLEQLLWERYPAQPITVENAGVGGEWSSAGRRRLPGVLDQVRPEVLLLLEGINDLSLQPASQVISNLGTMARTAQARGVVVLLATLIPLSPAWDQTRPGIRARVTQANAGIVSLAAELRLGPVVDLYALFSANPDLMAQDGKHPNEAGQTAMAQAFFKAVVERFEIVDGAPAPTLTSARVIPGGALH